MTKTRRARSSPSTSITRFLHRTSGTGLHCVFRKAATGIRRIALARSRAHSAERGTFIAEAPTCEWWIVSEGIGFRKMTGAHPCLPMSRATRRGKLTLFHPLLFQSDPNLSKLSVLHQGQLHQATRPTGHPTNHALGTIGFKFPSSPAPDARLLYILTNVFTSSSPSIPQIHPLAIMPVAIVRPRDSRVSASPLTHCVPKGRARRPATLRPTFCREPKLSHILGFLVLQAAGIRGYSPRKARGSIVSQYSATRSRSIPADD